MSSRPTIHSSPPPATAAPAFAPLLESAVTEPGVISGAYRAFHHFSIGNGLLAWAQCLERGVPPGPIATYSRWQALGRQGKAAAKATSLRIPVTLAREEGGGRRRKTRRQTDRADAGADPTVGLPRRLARAAR